MTTTLHPLALDLNKPRHTEATFKQGLKKGATAVFYEHDGQPYRHPDGWTYIEVECIITGFNYPLILSDQGSWHYSRLKH